MKSSHQSKVKEKYDVVVVGGGAAGLMAAYTSSSLSASTLLIEKNEKPGKKLYITGKGRCNLTNACDVDELFYAIVHNKKFLYSAFYGFSNADTIELFKSLGLRTKTERGGRVFPVSDKASDVTNALYKGFRDEGGDILSDTLVTSLLTDDKKVCGVVLDDGSKVICSKVILACGGVSYPSTGSDGSGFDLVKSVGHTVTKLSPGLTGLELYGDKYAKLQGLTLKNTLVRYLCGDKRKCIYEDIGEILFTHYGVSGPLALTISSLIDDDAKKDRMKLCIDIKPGLDMTSLDKRVIRDFDDAKNKDVSNAMIHLMPRSLIPVVLDMSHIPHDTKVYDMTRTYRERLIHTMKNMEFDISDKRGFSEAVITQGGVLVKEINPSTMESKLIKNLYMAGEMIDVDALTGGYNLQIAWSTGRLAGISAANT